MATEGLRFALVVPTLGAQGEIAALLRAAKAQTCPPQEILVMDSSKDDETARAALGVPGVRVIRVTRFDHGGTRRLAMEETRADVVLFMTQDALPSDRECFSRLLAPFAREEIAAVTGRQIAKDSASDYERLVRAYRYPQESDEWGAERIAQDGLGAYRLSNVLCAYRADAVRRAGGFDHPVETNEDMLMAQKLLACGFRLAYRADAAVVHSHDFTLCEQFERNRKIGRTLETYRERLACRGEAGEGAALARYVLGRLAKDGKWMSCARFMADCAARLAGNRIGRLQGKIKTRRERGARDA